MYSEGFNTSFSTLWKSSEFHAAFFEYSEGFNTSFLLEIIMLIILV